MTGEWAATNTLRRCEVQHWGDGLTTLDRRVISKEFDAALALVETALDDAADLSHWTRRMLQALDAYWLHYDGYHGRGNPLSESTAEDWWIRFEKYRAKVEAALRAVREGA